MSNNEAFRVTRNPFILDKKYDVEVDILGHTCEAIGNFVGSTTSCSQADGFEKVLRYIDKKGNVPTVKYYQRENERHDKVLKEAKITDYLREAYRMNDCVVPSLTRYLPSAEDGGVDSYHKKFTLGNLERRSKTKKAAATAYANGDMWLYSELSDKQKILKLLNNAMSGAFASPGTVHYNPSAHYTLTSITRSVASIGNVYTEMMVAGNRAYFTVDDAIAHLTSTVVGVPDHVLQKVVDDYGLVIPTVDDVMEMVTYSTSLYWKSKKDTALIRRYISGIKPIDRAKCMYNNDLYHTYKLNKSLIGRIIRGIGGTSANVFLPEDTVDACKGHPEYITNLVIHICAEEMPGVELKPDKIKEEMDKGNTHSEFGVEYKRMLNVVASTYDQVSRKFDHYSGLFEGLFANRIMPINGAFTKLMVRRAIVLSDTDSTCGSYGWWVEDILGREDYSAIGIGISASVMTIVGLGMENSINGFTANMNVGTKSAGMLRMKNEYFWKKFAIGKGTKHYYAMVNIKEGLVFREPQLELKGSQFILSNTPLKYRKFSDDLYNWTNSENVAGRKVSIREVINKIIEVEEEISDLIDLGDLSVLSTTEVKPEGSYKKPLSSAYSHYIMWNEVFADKYGKIPPPPYLSVKYKITINNKTEQKAFFESIKDKGLKERMINYCKKYDKVKMTQILMPLDVISVHGVPDELREAVDRTSLIASICKAMYLTLGTLGFNVPDEATLLSLGYRHKK